MPTKTKKRKKVWKRRPKIRVWNHGRGRSIPYLKGQIHLGPNWGFETHDVRLAKHLGKFPFITVEILDRGMRA